jgi:hypothetical protein
MVGLPDDAEALAYLAASAAAGDRHIDLTDRPMRAQQ